MYVTLILDKMLKYPYVRDNSDGGRFRKDEKSIKDKLERVFIKVNCKELTSRSRQCTKMSAKRRSYHVILNSRTNLLWA